MIVYQIIKECSVSYRDNTRGTSICLHEGDFIFLSGPIFSKKDGEWYDPKPVYEPLYLLTDIYYKRHHFKKVNDEVVVDFTWTWENEQNIINPVINRTQSVIFEINGELEFAEEFLKDVSINWNRDKMLEDLLDN
jgi:hypothetical protein